MKQNYESEIKNLLNDLSLLIFSSHLNFNYDNDADIYFIDGKIIFIDGSQLIITERYSLDKHRYRFHYMDKSHKLITRWDNAPHHKEVKHYPHHQHLSTDIKESDDKNLMEVINWISRYIEVIE